MTYNVTFPNLGWSFKINDVAFNIGTFSIKWYGIIIAVGFLLAFIYGMTSCKKLHIDQDKLLDVVIVGLIGGIIGARLYYVAFDTSGQYVKDPLSILYITNGGLGVYGGIIGGLLFGGIVAKIRKLSVPAILDISALGFLIGQGIGRWGNFVNQECFGTQTDLPWAMQSENTAAFGAVHPCFFYEFLWCLIGFILLHIFTRKFRRYDGQTFLGYVIWYGIGRYFIEGLRTDSLLDPSSNFRISQVVAVVSIAAAIVLLFVFRNRTKLTGCGSKKIMALNSIVDEVPEEEPDDGVSTIFGDLDSDVDETDALADKDGTDEAKSVETDVVTVEKDEAVQNEPKESVNADAAIENDENKE